MKKKIIAALGPSSWVVDVSLIPLYGFFVAILVSAQPFEQFGDSHI